MELGFSGEAFGNLLVLDAFVSIPLIFAAILIANRRGVDVTARRFQVKAIIACAIIFLIIPFSLCDLSLWSKIEGIALSLAVGVGNYIGIGKMRRVLWGDSVDKKKNGDRKM